MNKIIITDFTAEHIPAATILAAANYEEERQQVPSLPHIKALPDLTPFVETGFNAVALDKECGELLGFMCFYKPWDNAFTTTARGSFSPLHGHGAVLQNRGFIYQQLYQVTSKKLIAAGATSHAIALYAHDSVAEQAFFHYGFGLRCIDAIRWNEPLPANDCLYTIVALNRNEAPRIKELRRKLSKHLAESPCYMVTPDPAFEAWLERAEARTSHLFAAFDGEKVIAFIEIIDKGENFATEVPDIKNICGAYSLQDYRGKGLMPHLLNAAITALQKEKILRLGVDFESFNPTANAFWLKYFTAYTHSVVRRIDEGVLAKGNSK